MDIRNILNSDSDTSKSAVHRSASLAQPPAHPPLPRQTSMPNFPPEYRQSYSPATPTPPIHHSPTQNSYFRERSLSVSPKTKVTSLSASHINTGSEYEAFQNPTPVSNNGHVIDTAQYHHAPIHTSPVQTMMGPPAYNSTSPIQTVRLQAAPSHAYSTPLQTPPAPTHSYQNHVPQINQSPACYSHSTNSAQNSISQLRRASQISAMTESPVANSRKRSLESATSENSQQPPPPKRRKHETPPVWAQRFDRSKEKVYTGPRLAMPLRSQPAAPSATIQRSVTPADIKIEHKTEQKVNGRQPTPPAGPDRSWQQELPRGWEPNFDTIVPHNDIVMEIADRIFDNIVECPFQLPEGSKWEIEAKLGHLIDQNTGERLILPIRSECVLDPGWVPGNVRFDSKMSMAQHKALNVYLNQETGKSQQRRERISYKHVVEVDTFYELPPAKMAQLPPVLQRFRDRKPQFSPRVRVTTDARTGQVKEKIIKFRIEDLEVLCPRRPDQCDYRISISLEYQYPHETKELIEAKEHGIAQNRRKDRMSYAHQFVQLDLTQVKGEFGEASHEMEVELLPEKVLEEGWKAKNEQPNRYEALIGTFLNYVRALSRAQVNLSPAV